MKKTLVSALTTALVVGAASTTFAAANPFSDVPADHWAYDAVTQLAADGVIEGYGDTTFRGQQNITRYEMAQMIAKAMAKTDVSAADKALIDKLAAEFSDELNNLGVRVSNLERNADMVKWNGMARYTYTSKRTENAAGVKKRVNDDELKLRLEPSAEVNANWHVKARIDANTDLAKDGDDTTEPYHGGSQNTTLKLIRVWADGQYGTTNIKLGKFGDQIDNDLIADTEFSGAAVTFGNKFKTTLEAGRWNLNSSSVSEFRDDNNKFIGSDAASNLQAIAFGYGVGKFNASASYRHLNSNVFKDAAKYVDNAKDASDDANIWAVGAGYRFDKNIALDGKYAQNTEADNYDKAWTTQLSYKGAQKANKGTWGLYAAYRHLGQFAAVKPTYDGVSAGQKGWEFGTNYTIFPNVVAQAKYFTGKDLTNDKDASKLFGRVEFFF